MHPGINECQVSCILQEDKNGCRFQVGEKKLRSISRRLFYLLNTWTPFFISAVFDDMTIAKLKEIQRLELVLPTKNIVLKDEKCLIDSVRKTIYEFFKNKPEDDKFIETLKWFIFEEYTGSGITEYQLANCPVCSLPEINLFKKQMTKDYTFQCNHCNNVIYLTDIFRLHEAVDNELGGQSLK